MSMFSETQKEQTCATVEECTRRDKVADNLWAWADRLESLGVVLCLLLLVGGLIVSWQSAQAAVRVTSWGVKAEFDWGTFLWSLVSWMLYAFIGYCSCHSLALLVGALAGIYQNTKTTARLQEYQLRNTVAQEAVPARSAQPVETTRDVAQIEQKEATPAPVAAPSGTPRGYGTVCCPQCGRSQSDAREKCYQCGAPLKTE